MDRIEVVGFLAHDSVGFEASFLGVGDGFDRELVSVDPVVGGVGVASGDTREGPFGAEREADLGAVERGGSFAVLDEPPGDSHEWEQVDGAEL